MDPLIFASCRACLSYFASAETVRDLLLPAETIVHETWLSADCLCDSASCRDSQQEAKSHGQSLQKAIYRAQQSWQKARDPRQSWRKSNMMDSLCRKHKSMDSFIPCVYRQMQILKIKLTMHVHKMMSEFAVFQTYNNFICGTAHIL